MDKRCHLYEQLTDSIDKFIGDLIWVIHELR